MTICDDLQTTEEMADPFAKEPAKLKAGHQSCEEDGFETISLRF